MKLGFLGFDRVLIGFGFGSNHHDNGVIIECIFRAGKFVAIGGGSILGGLKVSIYDEIGFAFLLFEGGIQ